jgi:hypothetical protein
MRKLVLLPLALCLWLGWGLYGEAQEDETRALLEKAIKAHGGGKALAAVKAVQIKGKGKMYQPMELTFTVEVISAPPDKMKLNVDFEAGGKNFTFLQVVDGKKGWRGLQGMIMEMTKKEMEEAREQAHVEEVTHLVVLRDKAYKLSPLGEMKVGEHDAVGIQVSKKGFRDVNLYFDKKTHQLLKSEARTLEPMGEQEVAQEKLFSDYKKQPGGWLAPMKLVVSNDGKKFMEVEISEIMTPDSLDPSVFAKP